MAGAQYRLRRSVYGDVEKTSSFVIPIGGAIQELDGERYAFDKEGNCICLIEETIFRDLISRRIATISNSSHR